MRSVKEGCMIEMFSDILHVKLQMNKMVEWFKTTDRRVGEKRKQTNQARKDKRCNKFIAFYYVSKRRIRRAQKNCERQKKNYG